MVMVVNPEIEKTFLTERGAIIRELTYYGLIISSYKSKSYRMYIVKKNNTMEKLSDSMTFSELRAWAQGFITGREGKKAVRF